MTEPTLRERLEQGRIQAGLELLAEDQDARRKLDEIVKPIRGNRIEHVYSFDGDHVVAMSDGLFAAVVGDRRPFTYQETLDAALVHLVALRQLGPRDADGAVYYAMRVLTADPKES